jgi:hypothetical protein
LAGKSREKGIMVGELTAVLVQRVLRPALNCPRLPPKLDLEGKTAYCG